jgi:hypothetical protein
MVILRHPNRSGCKVLVREAYPGGFTSWVLVKYLRRLS